MDTKLVFDFTVDKANRTILVKREFSAPLDNVWAAWTQSELLDKWWAPKPWEAQTKSMDFRPGGRWLYAMVSPEGQKHWSLSDFQEVQPKEFFSTVNAFTDEDGKIEDGYAGSKWVIWFNETKNGTVMVEIIIEHQTLESLEKYIAMGFKEGFTMGLGNLETLLATQQ